MEELCARIRNLCSEPLSDEGEEELRRLALHLRTAIQQHIRLAKSSLRIKKSAISDRDSEQTNGTAEVPLDK